MQVSQTYGVRRPREIAARVARFRVLCPVSSQSVAVAPTLVIVPVSVPAAPPIAAPVAKVTRHQIAPWQSERDAIVADLPILRHYAANWSDGPTSEEIAALETRLADLDDFLIFEPETDGAQTLDAVSTYALPRAA